MKSEYIELVPYQVAAFYAVVVVIVLVIQLVGCLCFRGKTKTSRISLREQQPADEKKKQIEAQDFGLGKDMRKFERNVQKEKQHDKWGSMGSPHRRILQAKFAIATNVISDHGSDDQSVITRQLVDQTQLSNVVLPQIQAKSRENIAFDEEDNYMAQ